MPVCIVKDSCCMCKNCSRVCKFNAISYRTDEYGFEHIVVDKKKCVGCNRCERVCPIIDNKIEYKEPLMSGMAYAIEPEIKRQGSSGGLFGAFAKMIFKKKGVVYGAAFDEELNLVTTRAETYEQLKPLYKSKYLLCDTNTQFERIEKDLKSNRVVLYCSCPCQIQALKLFLNKDYENLYMVDFVCHGVSSQKIFDKFREEYENRNKCKLKSFQFRYKTLKPSSSHYFKLGCIINGSEKIKTGLYFGYPYYNAYCKQIISRSNCYDCKFAKKERMSDITIGDFHTVEKYFKNIDRFSGISMFLCNTKKGMELLNYCRQDLYISEVSSEILYANNRFSQSSKKEIDALIDRRNKFLAEFFLAGMSKNIKCQLITKKDYLKIIYYKSPLFLRKIAKELSAR